MAFRFKDLMIEVLPGGADPANATCGTLSMDPARQAGTCGTLSMDPAQAACGAETYCPTISQPAQAACGGTLCPTLSMDPMRLACGGTICPTLSQWPTPMVAAAGTTGILCGTLTMFGAPQARVGLSTLKQHLQQALEQVEAQERAAAQGAAGLPATAEEADDLERRLREAIEELQEHRKTLAPAKTGAKARKPGKPRK